MHLSLPNQQIPRTRFHISRTLRRLPPSNITAPFSLGTSSNSESDVHLDLMDFVCCFAWGLRANRFAPTLRYLHQFVEPRTVTSPLFLIETMGAPIDDISHNPIFPHDHIGLHTLYIVRALQLFHARSDRTQGLKVLNLITNNGQKRKKEFDLLVIGISNMIHHIATMTDQLENVIRPRHTILRILDHLNFRPNHLQILTDASNAIRFFRQR